ncbi:MAG: LLM class flavin-dependent oxidoreductase [Gammaproteobacteria bacterium]|nr:LLM class flavin-dependent oxidoreductase [Gammaproteobacteria bacterium]
MPVHGRRPPSVNSHTEGRVSHASRRHAVQPELHRLGPLRGRGTRRGRAAAAEQIRSRGLPREINIARIADETGFDTLWTIEHHFTPYTMVTNPLQYLSYIAGITERVDLGTMVVVLPWHNPVRVAEDINMLDTFLGLNREIICGVGRGLGCREYEGWASTGPRRGHASTNRSRCCANCRHRAVQLEEHFNIKACTAPATGSGSVRQPVVCRRYRRDGRNHRQARHPAAGHPDPELGLSLETAKSTPPCTPRPVTSRAADAWRCGPTSPRPRRKRAKVPKQYMVEYSDSALRHYELLGDHLGKIKGYESYGAAQDMLRKDATPFRRGFFNRHPWGTRTRSSSTSELANEFGVERSPSSSSTARCRSGWPRRACACSPEVMPALKELDPKPLVVQEAAA